MVTLTCKCGKTTKTFKYMKKSDFPDGWETDCCKEDESWKEIIEDEKVIVEEPTLGEILEEVFEEAPQPVVETVVEEPAPKKKTSKKSKKS